MTTEECKSLKSVLVVDARGTACPGTLLAVKKAIQDLEPGKIMEILSADEVTKCDIPRWCENAGHKFLGFYKEDSFNHLFLVKNLSLS